MQKIASGEFYERASKKYATKVKADIKQYPAYHEEHWRRTGELGRKWYANSKKEQVEFGNTKPYAGWVQGEGGNPNYHQVWWHKRTGWKKIDDVADKHMGYYKEQVIKELQKAMR